MTKEEIINVLYDKEKWEVYYKFKTIVDSINNSNELYQYSEEFIKALSDEKGYIRMRSFILLCGLSKWDKNNIINANIDLLLNIFDEAKPTEVRMCLKNLELLINSKKELIPNIKDKLLKIDCSKYKDSMSPLIKKDINNLLKIMNL